MQRLLLSTLATLLLTPLFICGQWQAISSAVTKASLRGVHNVGNGVVWVSGSEGTILRTTNSGLSWQRCPIPPDTEKLDFRGIWGFNADRAIMMSSGPGNASRLYETTDGCRSCHLLFINPDQTGFWDAIAFSNEKGVVLGDPVDNQFVIYITTDGGKHWMRGQSAALAAHSKGEGAFAASNSALAIRPDGKILFGTGGLGGPRIFAFDTDNMAQWTVVSVPLKGNSEAAGVFSLAFRDNEHGVAVGGDYKNPQNRDGTAAFTSDGGTNWRVAAVSPGGYRSAVGWDQQRQAWIAAGPNGSDVSMDDGQTWRPFDGTGWNALSLPWAVGS
ncbi:MAG: hypothetical protein JO185_01890, partial [Acidobacteriaceae bacterium]|nr:hypothetical protein [Acidobacteriaceae bacterium]